MRRKDTERAHCYALMEWASYHSICKDLLFHIPNERKCTPAEGWALKRMGVRAGVSDYFLPYPTAKFNGLWIEMKMPGRLITPEQKSWLESMKSLKFAAHVAYGVDQAIEIIEKYLKK